MAFNASFIYGLLEGLLCRTQKPLRIVQVGANDGVTNDPIYYWIHNNLDMSELTLIEPLQDVFKKLKANYSTHPNVSFHNNAIGGYGQLKLYRINNKYDALYKGITASGITSYNREYVLNKIKKNLNIDLNTNPEDCIQELIVDMLPLKDLLLKSSSVAEIDFLQIDTEGYDDEVIYNSNLETLAPSAINYEFVHLSETKLLKLNNYLNSLEYKITRWSADDCCAIKIR